MYRVLVRYFPRELCRLLRGVAAPIKRRSYFSDYLRLWNVGMNAGNEETRRNARENDRRRRCLWWQMNAMLGYTTLLYFAQFGLDLAGDRVAASGTNVAMWRVALCDITYHMLTHDPEIKLPFAFLTILAIYFNYRSYRKIDYEFLFLLDRIVFCRVGWRGFFPARRYLGAPIEQLFRVIPIVIVNGFQVFIIAFDIFVSAFVLSKLMLFFGEPPHFKNWDPFTAAVQITVWLGCAINFIAIFGSVLLYTHLCILQATTGMIGLFAMYARISQNQVALKSKRLRKSRIDRFERFNVGSIEVFALANRAFANIFLSFLLCNGPTNVYYGNSITLNRFARSVGVIISFLIIIGHQVLALFGIHLVIAQLSKRFHRSGRLLLALFARNRTIRGRRVSSSPRFALRVSLIIARLHVTRRYGILYGRIALVSMPLFVKFLAIYSEFWMFLRQQTRHHH